MSSPFGINPFDEQAQPVLYWHYEGLAPSQIAVKLGRDVASVRGEITAHWEGDKRNRRKAK